MQAATTFRTDRVSSLEAVERRLQMAVGGIEHPAFRSMAQGAIAGGKRIRPMLTCLACEAAGGDASEAIEAATAVELLHVASLVHDDIMDRSEVRRGRPTVCGAHGIPAAVMAGDLILAAAFRTISESASPRCAEMTRIMIRSFADLCEGQSYDLLNGNAGEKPWGRHRKTVAQKTARLLESAATFGGISAGADAATVAALGTFGLNIGMAYQAQDDLLDAEGNETEAGKPLRRDERNGTTTYLTVAGSGMKAAKAVRTEARRFTDTALDALDQLQPSEARETLRRLALKLMDRKC